MIIVVRRERPGQLVDTGNLGLSYCDSSINVWLLDQWPEKVAEAAEIMAGMPDVTAVWRNDGDHFRRVAPIRWDRMYSGGERAWFARKAQELVDTQAADCGPDLVATLPDDTTYSVAGDHGGIPQGPPGRGPVGRHHADDPRGDGDPGDLPDGRRWHTTCRLPRSGSRGGGSHPGGVRLGWNVEVTR